MAKTKVKQFKCYYCKGRDIKENMLVEEGKIITKTGAKSHRYFHPECKKAKMINKDNQVVRTGAWSSEGKEHLDMKNELYNSIKSGELTLVDQFGCESALDNKNLYKEAPVIKEYSGRSPFVDFSTCDSCFAKYEIDEERNIVRDRICRIKETEEGNHPCLKCPFNTLQYLHIFDIGLSTDGKYTDAIEVLNTSGIKKQKIVYCVKNKINLYEVKTDEKVEDNKIHVQKIWWMDDEGKLKVHEDYMHYFRK